MTDSLAQPRRGGWPKRYTVVGLCFFAAFICYIDRVNISVAAIAMKDQFGWTETDKGIVLSSFFVGYMLTMALAGWLADRYGPKRVLGFAVVWWSVFTVLTPFATFGSFGLLIAARIAFRTTAGSYESKTGLALAATMRR